MQQIEPGKTISAKDNETKDEDYMKTNIEDLIELNNGEDIEIQFFCNGERLELNKSFYEIIKSIEADGASKKQAADPSSKSAADHIRDVIQSMSSGYSMALPNYHTIYFLIVDKR